MKTIVDYIIVTNEYGDIKKLMTEVKNNIKNGWQPHGSLCAGSPSGGNTTLHQAMVKYELVIQPAPVEPEKTPEPVKEEPKPADGESDVNPAPTTPAP